VQGNDGKVDLVMTGAGKQRGDLDRAIEQISKTFMTVKRLKVGSSKLGDPSVKAVSVSQILPSQLATLVPKYSLVVNDDDIGEGARKAAELPNGLLLHEYTDIEGE